MDGIKDPCLKTYSHIKKRYVLVLFSFSSPFNLNESEIS